MQNVSLRRPLEFVECLLWRNAKGHINILNRAFYALEIIMTAFRECAARMRPEIMQILREKVPFSKGKRKRFSLAEPSRSCKKLDTHVRAKRKVTICGFFLPHFGIQQAFYTYRRHKGSWLEKRHPFGWKLVYCFERRSLGLIKTTETNKCRLDSIQRYARWKFHGWFEWENLLFDRVLFIICIVRL